MIECNRLPPEEGAAQSSSSRRGQTSRRRKRPRNRDVDDAGTAEERAGVTDAGEEEEEEAKVRRWLRGIDVEVLSSSIVASSLKAARDTRTACVVIDARELCSSTCQELCTCLGAAKQYLGTSFDGGASSFAPQLADP